MLLVDPAVVATTLRLSRNPLVCAIALASPSSKLAEVVKSGGKRASIFPSWAPRISAGTAKKIPTASATSTPSTAAPGPQFEGGKERSDLATPSLPARLASMSPAVSQVSRGTRTRLTILRRLLLLGAFLVVAAIVLAQFTSLGKLAAGIFASTAVLGR